ncbi:MAG: SurA N-terminal domain-containing protein [Devosia sp.]|nr:SurA N-terminal domain-containing protein [Devosia sp.]
MLNALRSIARTWFGKVLGAFLIVGLAGFGIYDVIFQFGANTVATVAGEDITVRDFQRAYDQQLNSLARQIGRVPTTEEALAFGLPSVVLNRLGSEAAINKFGEDLGIGVSEQRLGKLVREDPSFSGTLGAFDAANFARVLQQNGFTEKEYFNLQTNAARRQQLASGLFGGSPTPQAAIDLISRYQGDKRTVDYFVLNAQGLPEVAPPTDEDLAAYLAENQTRYRTRENRTVDLLVLTPQVIAATKSIPEDQIAAEYERTKESRIKVEKRTIKQIALKTPQQEKWFELGKASGKKIGELLVETGLAFSDLGTLSRGEISDASLADAAFGLGVDDYALIEGIGGKRVITVSAIEAGGQVSLEDSRDQIAQQLALTEARNEFTDVLDQIEELRAAFRPLTDIADRFGLKTQTLAVTAGGNELADVAAEDRARVASAIFAAEQGDLAPTVTLGSSSNVWFDLKVIEAARDQSLDEVRDAIVAAWTQQQTDEALNAEVDKVLEQLKAGTPFADIAVALNQFPILSQPLTRNGDGTSVLNEAVAQQIFNGGADHFGSAINGDGDHVVFQVVDVTVATSTDATPASIKFVEDSTRDALYADFVAGLRDKAGLQLNQQALNQLLALDTAGQ